MKTWIATKSARLEGFTLIELLVTIAVLAILLTLAVPSVQNIIRDNRVTSQANELVALINLARNEAIRRNIEPTSPERATLRLDSDGSTWSANVSVTGGDTAEGCPTGVIRCANHQNVGLTTSSSDISFESRGYIDKAAWSAEEICLKHEGSCSGDRQHRRIRILPSGQIENVPLGCNEAC